MALARWDEEASAARATHMWMTNQKFSCVPFRRRLSHTASSLAQLGTLLMISECSCLLTHWGGQYNSSSQPSPIDEYLILTARFTTQHQMGTVLENESGICLPERVESTTRALSIVFRFIRTWKQEVNGVPYPCALSNAGIICKFGRRRLKAQPL